MSLVEWIENQVNSHVLKVEGNSIKSSWRIAAKDVVQYRVQCHSVSLLKVWVVRVHPQQLYS